MKGHFACLLVTAIALSACGKSTREGETETRPLSTRDKAPKLHATSDQRFRDAKPVPVVAEEVPAGWLSLPASQFRLLNYRFGASGLGEVWVSLSGGGLRENANRWLAQFGAKEVDEEGFAALRRLPVVGSEGVWVEASGTYASGMGAEPREGFALAGVITQSPKGVLTVKMVAPASELAAARAELEAFIRGLRLAE